jgi:MoxR-like ATPase
MSGSKSAAERAQEFAKELRKITDTVGTVIRGKGPTIKNALACWLAGGHLLIEDVPGTGKTILARAIATCVSVPMKRVQFTPDLLPSDILGTSLYDKESGQLRFMGGPIFTTVLLADEINRATPRTQSALLEAMAEGQVSAEGQTMALPKSFFVIATQNPVEQQGTFPLPEAQLDRFMMRLSMGYPDLQAERDIIRAQIQEHPIKSLQSVMPAQAWEQLQVAATCVRVTEGILNYATELVSRTRQHEKLLLGCSPRASISLIQVAQARALIEGLAYVKPDFIKALAHDVLEHRLVLTPRMRMEGVQAADILDDILNQIPVPIE